MVEINSLLGVPTTIRVQNLQQVKAHHYINLTEDLKPKTNCNLSELLTDLKNPLGKIFFIYKFKTKAKQTELSKVVGVEKLRNKL